MSMDNKKTAELLGALSMGLDHTLKSLMFDLLGALDKGNIQEVRNIANALEIDLKSMDQDLVNLSKELGIQPTHNGIKLI